MRRDDFNIDTLISDLTGTCKTINEMLPEGMTEDDLTEMDTDKIDSEIFRCETCSWWCENDEAHEVDEGLICKDCHDG